MAPITRFINGLAELVTGTFKSTLNMFESMDPIQLATLAVCVLVVGAMCMRGSPVRGA